MGYIIDSVDTECGIIIFTLCILGNFSCFLLSSGHFFKINFFKKLFHEHYQSAKQSGSRLCGSRSGPSFVGFDLGKPSYNTEWRCCGLNQQPSIFHFFDLVTAVSTCMSNVKEIHVSRTLAKSVYQKIIFLFLKQNICCGYSNEQSQSYVKTDG